MASISLYTDTYRGKTEKFTADDLDTTGVWYHSTDQTSDYDYRIDQYTVAENPTSSDTETHIFKITIPIQGVNKINDEGEEIIKCPEYILENTGTEYNAGKFEDGMFTLSSSSDEYDIYFNDFFAKGEESANSRKFETYSNITTKPVTVPYKAKNGYSARHFYTRGGWFFPVKHNFYYRTTAEMAEGVAPLSTMQGTYNADGFFNYGIDGKKLIENLAIRNKMVDNFNVSSGIISQNKVGKLSPVYKIKLITFTIPEGAEALKNTAPSPSSPASSIVTEYVTLDRSYDCVGIISIRYSSDGVAQSASITATTRDIWIGENGEGYWGEGSDIDGGSGIFTDTSDNRTADELVNEMNQRSKDRATDFLAGAGQHGLHLYTNFNTTNLLSKLFTKNWFTQFEQSFYTPLSGVISLHSIPKTFVGSSEIEIYDEGFLQDSGSILLSGYNTEIPATAIHNSLISFKAGTIDFTNLFFDAYPDYEPYTKILINLPFCGKFEITPSLVMGGYADIVYNINLATGDVCVVIYTYDREGKSGATYSITGNCATQYPVASYVGGASAISSIVSAGVSTAVSVVSENPLPLISTAKSLFDAVTTSHKTQLTGSVSGSPAFLDDWHITVLISRPVWSNPARYSTLMGIPSDISGTISANDYDGSPYTGYLKCRVFDVMSVSGATDEERAEIERLMTSGIYI